MVLAWLLGLGPDPAAAEEGASLARLREGASAGHFCQASSRNVTPHAFAEGIANQLCEKVAGFGEALAASLVERVSIIGDARADTAAAGARLTGVSIARLELAGLGDELSFDRTFNTPLKKMFAAGHLEPILLLVDGLDEALTYGGTTLVSLLSQSADLPPTVRILATTRNDPRVLKFFRGVRCLDLKRDAVGTVDDIREYALERLSVLKPQSKERIEFATRLAKRADGVFLYAALVLDELTALEELPELCTYALPEKLSGLYHEFLTRELGRNENLWFEAYEPLLGLVAVAQGDGLTTSQLTALTGRSLREALRASKQYLSGDLPEGPFRPFHKSFSDFLLETDEGNLDYHIEAKAWHDRIGAHYLTAFQELCEKRTRSIGSAGPTLDDYGLNNLCTHLLAAGRTNDAMALIDEPWMRVRSERAAGLFGPFQDDVDKAWHAALAQTSTEFAVLLRLKTISFAVQEQVGAYDDDDLALLVMLGRFDEAIAHARLRWSPGERAASLHRVILAWVREHKRAPSTAVVEEVRQAFARMDDLLERVRALGHLVDDLAQADPIALKGILDDMRSAIGRMRDAERCAVAERCLVEALAVVGELEDGARLATAIGDAVQAAFALKVIAVGIAKTGDFERALALTGRIDPSRSVLSGNAIRRIRAEALAEVALAQALAKHPEAAATFIGAERVAMEITDDEFDRGDALRDLSAALFEAGRLEEATRVAQSIAGWHREYALLPIIEARASAGEVGAARELQRSMTERNWIPHGHRALAAGLAAAGEYEEAIAIVRQLGREDRFTGLMHIEQALRKRNDQRADKVVTEASEQARELTGKQRAQALSSLIRAHWASGDLVRAREVFRRKRAEHAEHANVGRDPRAYCSALSSAAVAFARTDEPRAARLVANARRAFTNLDSNDRDDQKRALAIKLADVEHFDDAESVLEAVVGEYRLELAWTHVATRLAGRGYLVRAIKAFERAIDVARRIPSDSVRDESLGAVASALQSAEFYDKLEEIAGWIHNTKLQAIALNRAAVSRHTTDPARARELFDLAESTARREQSDYSRDEALAEVVCGLAETWRFEDALRVVATIADGLHRVRSLCALSRQLTRAGEPRGRELLEEGFHVLTSEVTRETVFRWGEAGRLRTQAIRHERDRDPAAATTWSEANTLAGSLWGDLSWWRQATTTDTRARALVEIAAVRNLESERDIVFALAYADVLRIKYDNLRNGALLFAMRRMLAEGRRDLAARALTDLHREQERRTGIAEMMNACLNAAELDEALRIARLEANSYYRRVLVRDVAVSLAAMARIQDALLVLEDWTLDGFIDSIAMVLAAWRAAPAGAVTSSLCEVFRVAAWVRSDWRKIHDEVLAG